MAAPKIKESSSDRTHQAYKAIRLREQHPYEATSIAKIHDLRPVVARVLAARGFKVGSDLKNYLNPTLREGLPAPTELKNIAEACELVCKIGKQGKPIAICCDFDVDGLTGGSQIQHFLTSTGIKSKVFVPDRFEDGYGLNEKMIRQIAEAGFGLIVCVDYGTTNLRELELARTLGVQTIVIDHHHVGDHKPACDVFINPQQQGCGFASKVLSASGLAWYFLIALKSSLSPSFPAAKKIDTRAYLDLACLGTICDMVPLIGANRVIAKRGLELLTQTKRAGLLALKYVIGIHREVNCYDVSFGIGPRINAAGRMVHGDIVVDLLTTENQSNADQIAHRLNRLNLERQDTESKVKEKALRRVNELHRGGSLPAGLVLWDESFHTGVIGIVAQRMVETFYRPTVILGQDSEGVLKGSVRGIKDFSVIEALAAVQKNLIKFGGHEGAGGLSVAKERINDFAEAFVEECEQRLSKIDANPYADADTEATLDEIDFPLVDQMKSLAPFGMGNPHPQLLLKKLTVADLRDIKSAHLKAVLTDGTRYLTGLLWRQTSHPALSKGAKVNVVIKADYSTFGGVTELQGNIQAVEAA